MLSCHTIDTKTLNPLHMYGAYEGDVGVLATVILCGALEDMDGGYLGTG